MKNDTDCIRRCTMVATLHLRTQTRPYILVWVFFAASFSHMFNAHVYATCSRASVDIGNWFCGIWTISLHHWKCFLHLPSIPHVPTHLQKMTHLTVVCSAVLSLHILLNVSHVLCFRGWGETCAHYCKMKKADAETVTREAIVWNCISSPGFVHDYLPNSIV